MKTSRLIAFLLAAVLLLSTVACGGNPSSETAPETKAETASETLPETDAETSSETKAPETEKTETPSETEAEETKAPETKAPETTEPETKVPETKAPETKVPETKVPETKAPETNAPETSAQGVQLSEKTTVVAPVADTTVKETGTILYVKSGSKNGDGSEAKPYGSVSEVLSAIKKMSPDSKRSIVVKLSAGEYNLTEPLHFTSSEYSKNAASITFLCPDNSPAVFSAWTKISGWSETKVNGVTAWQATLPKDLDPQQFFTKDGERMARPRLPETGFYTVDGVPNVIDPFRRDSPWALNCDMAFNFQRGLLPEFSQPDKIEIRVPHYWVDELLNIKSIDYTNSIVHMTTASAMALCESGFVGARYYFDNVLEALDKPGEVYADTKAGKIYYIPKSGESMNSFYLYASNLDTIMTVENMRGSEGSYALTFKNIAFVGSDHSGKARNAYQSATDLPAAITVNHSSYIRFLSCKFEHIGHNVIGIPDDSDHITIDRCDFLDIGATGIHVTGSYKTPVHDVLVSDCIFDGFGKVYADGGAVVIRFADHCYVVHNTITDGYASAISSGWVWGINVNSATHDNLIERNHIYNVGQGYISDFGAIYTLGPQEGTVVRQNLIHDIRAYEKGYGGAGIYPDEGSSYMIYEDNIVYNTMDNSLGIHYGQENIVRNNILAFSQASGFHVGKLGVGQSKRSAFVSNNIILTDGRPAYLGIPGSSFWVEDDSNLYWNISGNVYCGTGGTRAQRYSPSKMQDGGLFKNAVVADPLFVDAKNYNFTLKPESPASLIGFRPLDLSDAGARR